MSEFGKVAVVLALIQFFYVLTDYGFTLSATYFISLNRNSIMEVNKKISVIFVSKSLIVVLVFFLAILAWFFLALSNNESVMLVAALVAIIAQAFQPMWFFQGIERMKDYTTYVVSSKFIYAALVIFFVSGPEDSRWVIISWALSQVLATIISIYLVRRLGYGLIAVTYKDIKKELIESFQYFLSRLSVFTYSSASVIFLSSQGAAQAAYFSVCDQIYKAGQSFTAPVNSAMYPYMAKDKNWSLFYKIFTVVILVLITGCIILALNAESLLGFLFGDQFAQGAEVLVMLLVATVINYVGVTFGYSAYAALNRPDIANFSVIFGGALHLIMLGGGALFGCAERIFCCCYDLYN